MTDFQLTVAQDKAMDVIISDAMNIALGGGSRSGKTFLLLRAIILRGLKCPGSTHVIFRYRFNAIKASIIYGTLPKVMELCFPGLWQHCDLNKTDWFLTLPNGSEVWFGGLDDKERTEKILGQEFATIYFNECSQIPYQSVVLAMSRLAQKTNNLRLKAYYDFNPPSKKHWTYRIFIDRKDPNTKQLLRNADDYAFYLINPNDNKENLDPKYLSILDAMPEKARNRFLLGRFADDSEGALWTEEVLAANRILNTANMPSMQRIVIAVDPSGCNGDEDTRSDEIGIIVVGLGTDGHAYILEDLSGRFGPADWGRVVVAAYHRHAADRIVAEGNYGGAMVEHVIRTEYPEAPFEMVTATRGKVVRAEPVSALYNQGKVHHVGYYPELEDQMCASTLGGYMGLRSPDRMDALVWAVFAIFKGLTQSEASRNWTPPNVITSPRKLGGRR
jgi:hypothetical protein